jgi:hypothetical protein
MRSPRSSRPDGSWHSAEIFPAVGTQRCDQHWEFPRNTVATRRACRRGAVPRCPRFSCANAEDPVTSSAAIVSGCTVPARRIRARNPAIFESFSPICPSRLARSSPHRCTQTWRSPEERWPCRSMRMVCAAHSGDCPSRQRQAIRKDLLTFC